MLKWNLSLPILVFWACIGWNPLCKRVEATTSLEDRPITIATWNLEWFFDDDTSDNRSDLAKKQSAPNHQQWEWKRDVVAEAISKFQPTILALQEIENRAVLMELTKVLKDKYQLSYRVAFIEGFDSATEQDVAFLYRSDLVEYSRREQTKKQFDSKQYYNLSKHLFARFEWEVDGKKESLLILNVHLRAKEEEAETRVRQSKLARAWLESAIQAGENVIFLGDTNIEEAYAESPIAGGELAILRGKNTAATEDDLWDAHQAIPADKRRTHLILDKQFDRILMSQSAMEDAPGRKDLVFETAAVHPEYCIRGQGPDLDHWENMLNTPFDERDISDHYPVVATFHLR